MKKTVKAYDLLTILGIVITVVIGALVFPNWSSHEEFSLSFPKNVSEKISSYYSCRSDELMVVQTSGNSKCKYTIYSQTRGQGSYTTVKTGITFKHNDEWDGTTYSLSSSWWNDIRFKVKKTAETGTASELALSLGKKD
ncbi:MAG: hypothetical protein K6E36_03380 [Oscillospiraceae bacterium]|nr:hypothetical protein [Oscillospiraceae bacterium]